LYVRTQSDGLRFENSHFFYISFVLLVCKPWSYYTRHNPNYNYLHPRLCLKDSKGLVNDIIPIDCQKSCISGVSFNGTSSFS
jgi:hypothetical protein